MNAVTGSTGISYGVQNRVPVLPEGRSVRSGKIRTAEVIVTKCHHAIPPVIPPVTEKTGPAEGRESAEFTAASAVRFALQGTETVL